MKLNVNIVSQDMNQFKTVIKLPAKALMFAGRIWEDGEKFLKFLLQNFNAMSLPISSVSKLTSDKIMLWLQVMPAVKVATYIWQDFFLMIRPR